MKRCSHFSTSQQAQKHTHTRLTTSLEQPLAYSLLVAPCCHTHSTPNTNQACHTYQQQQRANQTKITSAQQQQWRLFVKCFTISRPSGPGRRVRRRWTRPSSSNLPRYRVFYTASRFERVHAAGAHITYYIRQVHELVQSA